MPRTLVLYACHEDNEFVQLFLGQGVYYHRDVDFVIVCNHPTKTIERVPFFVTVINRENIGHDFGAWSHGLLTGDRYKSYSKFIFLNSTCAGPFVSPWCSKLWTDIFLEELYGGVHLIGPTINCIRNPRHTAHVQSYAFAMDSPAVELLIDRGIFSLTTFAKDKIDAVNSYEIRMSREILAHGWNIAALMYYPRSIDWTFKDMSPEDYNIKFLGDVTYPRMFFGETPHPYECVFVKANRGQRWDWLRTYAVGDCFRKVLPDPGVELPVPSIDAQSC